MKRLLFVVPLLVLFPFGAHSERLSYDGVNWNVSRQIDGKFENHRLYANAFTSEAIASQDANSGLLAVSFALDTTKHAGVVLGKHTIALRSTSEDKDGVDLYLPLAHEKTKEGVFSLSLSLPESYRKNDIYLEVEVLAVHSNKRLCLQKIISIADLYSGAKRNLTKQ